MCGYIVVTNIVAISSDHAGFDLKEILKPVVEELGFSYKDLGGHDASSVDYPDMGKLTADEVASGAARFGIVICGSGIGISIAANRNIAVRAALCHNVYMAEMARKHNDANILALGARVIDVPTAIDCVKKFLSTEFEGGRHKARVEKLSQN